MEYQVVHLMVVIACSGVAAQWLAWRFRIPAIVVLTAAGLLLGPAFGVLHPSENFGILLTPFVQLAVAVILFEGGLNLHLHELKDAGVGLRRLVTVGPIIAFALGSGAAHFIGGLSWPVALVFGAITIVTGPTVIMPLLRHARLRARTASILKWEGIVNDPIGALLAVALFEYFTLAEGGASGFALIAEMIETIIVAALFGGSVGYVLGRAYPTGNFPEYLKGPTMLAAVLFVYAGANMLHEEAGLVAATTLGLVMGNMNLPSIDELRRFKEYITVILVSGLFIVLTADLDTGLLFEMNWRSWALLATLIFIVRPAVVFLATMGAGLDREDRVLIGWIAPRGIVAAAVAGAFSVRMAEAGYEDAVVLLPLVFALILLTVTLHGFSISHLARYLGIASKKQNGLIIIGASPWTIDLAKNLVDLAIPVILIDASWHRLRAARLSGLPVYFGQVVSASADEVLDLSSMGYLLAASDNDAYNALVCTRFANEFGRSRVFQIPMPASDQHETKGLLSTLRGHTAFPASALYEEILRRYFQGWRFQKTRFTESYTFDDYRGGEIREAFASMLVRPNGALVIGPADHHPNAGDTLISFVAPKKLPTNIVDEAPVA
jgi:NhaP-type Na+/H+ or K+/H+ antiporter